MLFGMLELELLLELEEMLEDEFDELLMEELLFGSEDEVELLLDEPSGPRQAGSARVRLTIASNFVVERRAAVSGMSINIFQPYVKSNA